MQNRIIEAKRTWAGSPTMPVSLTEVKTQLHLTDSENDTELTDMIKRITKRVEDYCNISIVSQTVVFICDLKTWTRLPYPPIVSIQSIKITPSTIGATTEDLTVSDYSLVGTQDAIFNSSRCNIHTINYTTGMSTVDDNLKLAILEEITYHYENRGEGEEIGFSNGALSLLEPYRNLWM